MWDVLVQVHIPKCAGTAVYNWMRLSGEAGLTSGFGALYGPELLDEQTLWSSGLHDARLTMISAHNIRQFPASLRSRPMHYFTVLRNPHAHRLSHLRFIIQERAGFGVPRHVGDSVGDILRWLYSDSSHLSFECPQTNHLALHTWCASAPKRCDPATYAAWRIDDRAAYQRDRLAIAKSILDSFLAVGVVERLAATAEIVRRRAAQYGLRLLPVSAIPVTNVTDPAIDSDASLLESGRVGDVDLDTLSDDEALYAYAERLLDAANNHAPLAAG